MPSRVSFTSTKLPTCTLASSTAPGRSRANGPTIAPSAIVAPSRCENERIRTLSATETPGRGPRHKAAVAQPDLARLLCRIARLDDAREIAVPVGHEAAIGGGVGRPKAGGGDRRRRRAPPLREQRRDRLGPQ